jgi:hypothetical protein
MAKMHISDKEFWAILRENAGIYARTARAISKAFSIEYTRDAVKKRAERYPERLQSIIDENLDIAEEGLHSLLRSKTENVRFRAVEFYLRTKGKSRGYVERSELTGKDGKNLLPELNLSNLDDTELKTYYELMRKAKGNGSGL